MTKQMLVSLLLVIAMSAQAQNLSKQGVLKLNVRSSGTIIQDDQVKGYYYFYKLDKQDRKNDNYLLSVCDENLREVNAVNITRPKNYVLVDAVFNGQAFAFLFYDYKGKSTELVSYDGTLKSLGSVKKKIVNKYALASYNTIVNGGEPTQAYLVPITGKGFVSYSLQPSKFRYEIQCYDNNLKPLWTDVADGKTPVEVASEGFQSGDYIGSTITRKKSVMTKDLEFDLMVHEVSSGKKLFRVPMLTDKYSVSFSDVFFDAQKKQFIVFGEYNDKNDKELKAPSLGFMTLTIDMTGKIINEKVNSWVNEISVAAPVNERGKFDGNNSRILFHDFVRTSDGSIFAIGEQYKKVASAAGIAGNVMMAAMGGNPGFSNAQLNVYNMVIFEFTSDYTIKKVYVFEKDKNVVSLPAGSEYVSSKLMSYYAKAYGGFDYSFTQRSADKKTFFVSYVNYDKEKGEQSKNVLGTIVYTPEKVFTVDKLPLNRKSTMYFVNRAKEGYVMVMEYFKKEKRLESRLEKVNY